MQAFEKQCPNPGSNVATHMQAFEKHVQIWQYLSLGVRKKTFLGLRPYICNQIW